MARTSTIPPYSIWIMDVIGNAARFFKQDPFHVFRLGIARNFIASSIIMLAMDGYFDSPGDSLAVDARLSRAWASFALWCHTQRVTTSGIRSFSKEKLHFGTSRTFPWAGCKGSDTILILRWIQWFSGLHLPSNPGSHKLMLVVRACASGLAFQGIHRHGIFLEKSCRTTIITSRKRFLHCYAELARVSLLENRTLYAMVPKAHSFDHIQHNLETIPQESKAVNPGFYDCSQSEDFVGRVARQSRRVSYRLICENVLLAYKVKARLVIGRFQKARKLGLEGWRLTSGENSGNKRLRGERCLYFLNCFVYDLYIQVFRSGSHKNIWSTPEILWACGWANGGEDRRRSGLDPVQLDIPYLFHIYQ